MTYSKNQHWNRLTVKELDLMVNCKDPTFEEMNEAQKVKSIQQILDIFLLCFGMQEKMIQKTLLKEYLRILNTDLKGLNISDLKHVYMENDIGFSIIANPSLKELILPLKSFYEQKKEVKNNIETFELEQIANKKQKEEEQKVYLKDAILAYKESLKAGVWKGNDFQLRTLFVNVFNGEISQDQKEKAILLRQKKHRQNAEALNEAIVLRQKIDKSDYNTLPEIYFQAFIVVATNIKNKIEI